jgi:hypothetical protein
LAEACVAALKDVSVSNKDAAVTVNTAADLLEFCSSQNTWSDLHLRLVPLELYPSLFGAYEACSSSDFRRNARRILFASSSGNVSCGMAVLQQQAAFIPTVLTFFGDRSHPLNEDDQLTLRWIKFAATGGLYKPLEECKVMRTLAGFLDALQPQLSLEIVFHFANSVMSAVLAGKRTLSHLSADDMSCIHQSLRSVCERYAIPLRTNTVNELKNFARFLIASADMTDHAILRRMLTFVSGLLPLSAGVRLDSAALEWLSFIADKVLLPLAQPLAADVLLYSALACQHLIDVELPPAGEAEHPPALLLKPLKELLIATHTAVSPPSSCAMVEPMLTPFRRALSLTQMHALCAAATGRWMRWIAFCLNTLHDPSAAALWRLKTKTKSCVGV